MSNYKILLFDIDDTLIIDRASIENGLREVFSSVGGEYLKDVYYDWMRAESDFWDSYRNGEISVPEEYNNGAPDGFGRNRSSWVRAQRIVRFMNLTDLGEAYRLLDLYEQGKMRVAQPMPGGLDLIKTLHGKYELIAATDEVHEVAISKLRLSGYDKYFSKVFSPLVSGCIKPKPEFFMPIHKQIGGNLEDYLMIGNSLSSDIQLACNVGIDSCLLWTSQRLSPESPRPTYIIDDISKLTTIL